MAVDRHQNGLGGGCRQELTQDGDHELEFLGDLLPGEVDDMPARGGELGVPHEVGVVVELGQPMAAAIQLDDDSQRRRISEVNTGDPFFAVSGVLLPDGLREPIPRTELGEPGLELTGRGDVSLAAGEEELPHNSGALPPSLAELSDHVTELACGRASAGNAVVEGPFDLLGISEDTSNVEQRPGEAGNSDPVDDDEVVRWKKA